MPENDSPAPIDTARLRRLLFAPELDWLVTRVAERIASGIPATVGTVALDDPEPGQRRAAERLLGRPPGRGRSVTVKLEDVDRVLKESGISPDGLAAAVLWLRGPITVRREAEAVSRGAWESALVPLARLIDERPELALWLNGVRSTSLLKRQAPDPVMGAELAEQARRVLMVLPHPGIVRPVLAAQTVGNAHALDDGRPLTALVLSAIRSLVGLNTSETTTAEGRRHAWAAVGVAADDVSSRVLTLNVPPSTDDDDALAPLLKFGAAVGEPLVLTLRQLNSLSWSLTDPRRAVGVDLAGTTISVCENPAVLSAAANALGASCPPMVCGEGSLSVAATRLLRWLLARGATLRYHGDFDWGGVRIATRIFSLADGCQGNVVPWRYDSASYVEATARGLGTLLPAAKSRATLWDAELERQMETHRLRVEEEHVIDVLLSDLVRDADGGR